MVVILNLYSVAYLCESKPFDSVGRNNTEIFNEWINLAISTLFMITMKIDGKKHRNKILYDLGLICNYLLLGMIAINLLFVVYGIAKDARLSYLRYWSLRREREMYKKLWLEAKKNETDDKKDN